MKTLNLAITEFAIPSPRTGHIAAYSGFGRLPNVGQAIHLEVQLARAEERPGYTPERWISHSFERLGHRITVGGRMDGFVYGAPAFVEEIKSAYQPEDLVRALDREPHHPYKLQLRTYGYLHSLTSAVPPELNLFVVNARTREGFDYEVDLDVPDFENWLERRLNELIEEQKRFDQRIQKRKRLAPKMEFPFPEPRPGQRELIETIGARLDGKARVLIQAPTGLGKTAGVLFPVLRDALKRGQKVIYLTAKNTQHGVAEDAVKRLQATGAKVRSVTLHAKAKMCLKEEPFCNPDYCEYARDHYTKFNDKDLPRQLRAKKRLGVKTLRQLGLANEVCPFELQYEAAPLADVVIGDYNYVFSPRNSSARLTHNGWRETKNLANVVVDEAHNLPARATDYFSATLACDELEALKARVPAEFLALAEDVVRSLKDLILEVSGGEILGSPARVKLDPDLLPPLQQRALELQARYLESSAELQTNDPVLRLSNLVADFTQSLALADENFFVTVGPSRAGGVLKLTCCEAPNYLKSIYGEFANVIAFSATLKPFKYYAELLGLDADETLTAEFASPFPAAHRKLLVIPQISTRFKDRARNYGKIKESIERLVALKPGNYFVFFPSFDFLFRVRELVDLPNFRLLTQRRDMKRDEIHAYVESLRSGEPTIIFAVQGGVFAEGVDYPGDMLIGALIVGPALPSFDFERELLREHFDRKHGQGFDYAYTYPAMARVVQSAGRVIRSAEDRGLIVLMDRRFLEEGYRKSMPREWTDDAAAVSTRILDDVREFWGRGGS